MATEPSPAYELCPSDSYDSPWLLWVDNGKRLGIRPQYADLVCRSCGKVDELAAISRGISADLTLLTKADVLGTLEDFGPIVSHRFRSTVARLGVVGLSFYPIPTSTTHSFALVDRLVKTDLALAGFQDAKPLCVSCGRFRERTVGPLVRSLTLPSERLVFFASTEWSESTRGRRQPVFATPQLADVLRLQRFRGIELIPAL